MAKTRKKKSNQENLWTKYKEVWITLIVIVVFTTAVALAVVFGTDAVGAHNSEDDCNRPGHNHRIGQLIDMPL